MSDIHGNLPALEKVISFEDVDGYLMLGDIVNYAPWSNECVDLINNLDNCVSLMGNHEQYFINKYCPVKNLLVKSFFNQCVEKFERFELISDFKKEIIFHGYNCVHTIENKYVFQDTDIIINNNYIIGHSHQQYKRKEKEFLLINPGSIGQNRKYINKIDYIIYNSDKNVFEMKYLTYNINLVINKMKEEGYPEECIYYYKGKQILK
jgi:predicted phosphodiesterase